MTRFFTLNSFDIHFLSRETYKKNSMSRLSFTEQFRSNTGAFCLMNTVTSMITGVRFLTWSPNYKLI